MTIKNLYPTQLPSLDLNFARTKRLDPRVDFERFSVGTYVGNDGLIKTAVDHEPRFDHDPATGESLGLLVEESRTNAVNRSSDFQTNWTNTNVSVVPNRATAPDGTLTATSIVDDSTNGEHKVSRSAYVSVPKARSTLTVFAKSNGLTTFELGTTGSSNLARFTLTGEGIATPVSGSTAPGGGGEVFIEKLANGWYRCGFQANYVSTIAYPYIRLYNSGTSYVGNGSGIYVWGLQMENSALFPTSYIPTSGSTVTRAADVVSLTNTNVYDTDSFTILNEPFGAAAGSDTLTIVGPTVKRTTIYNQNLTQTQINTLVKKDDEFWRWRILGSSFGLPNFTTDGQVTVDWGDGTVETLTTSDHTFTDGGGYHDIGFRLDSGTYFSFGLAGNPTHRDKVVAIGPAPASMGINAPSAFYLGANIECIDGTVRLTNANNDADNFMRSCTKLKSVPFIDTSHVDNFAYAWAVCSSLTSFPLIDTSSGTTFNSAWYNCSSLTTFPANFFDSWTGTPANSCFAGTWDNCSSLTATSVENILNSIDTSGQSAPASGVDITIDYDAGTGHPYGASLVNGVLDPVPAAITNLKSRGWTITLNGVAQ